MTPEVEVRGGDRPVFDRPRRKPEIGGGHAVGDGPLGLRVEPDLLPARGDVPLARAGALPARTPFDLVLEQPGAAEPRVQPGAHLRKTFAGDRVPAGEVHRGKRSDPQPERPSGGGVHFAGVAEPFLHGEGGGEEQPLEHRIESVAEPVPHRDGDLPDLLVEPEQPRKKIGVRVRSRHLDHQVALGGEEVVRHRRPLGAREAGEDPRRLDVRRVGEQHGVLRRSLLGGGEDPLLDPEIFGGRLDHQIRAVEAAIVRGELDGGPHRRREIGGERAGLLPLPDLGEQLLLAGGERRVGDVEDHDGDAVETERLREVERDVRTDVPRADDRSATDRAPAPGKTLPVFHGLLAP